MHARRSAVFTIAAVTAVLLAMTPVAGHADAVGFTSHLVAADQGPQEPGVWFDAATHRTYVFGLGASVDVWRSDDLATWAGPAATGGGGGDADLATDANGVVYAADLLGKGLNSTIPVSVSIDHGVTFSHTVELDPNASGIAWDRQWLAVGSGRVVVTANGGGDNAWVSTNGAQSFSGPVVVNADAGEVGPIMVGPDGVFHQALEVTTSSDGVTVSSDDIAVASSADGVHWTTETVAPLQGGNEGFPVVATDDAGALYVAWGDTAPHGATIYFAHKPIGGTWSQPVALSPTTSGPLLAGTPLESSPSALFPYVSAGSAGRVAIAWYQAREDVGGTDVDLQPDLGLPTTHWDIKVAESLDGGSTFTNSTAVENFHTGSICTSGIACAGPQNLGLGNVPTPYDRRDLDLFETSIDAAGHLLIAYPQDRPATTGDPNDVIFSDVDIRLAVQTSGPLLRATTTTVTHGKRKPHHKL